MKKALFLFCLLIALGTTSFAQTKEVVLKVDSSKTVTAFVDSTDTIQPVKRIRTYIPRVAAIRSAIVPGLGQIYNRKYWKLPIVYGALGISGSVFTYNLQWYKRTRYAYKVLYNKDTQNYPKVHQKLQNLITNNELQQLAYLREEYRRDIDYSALFFVLLWGLNVVDATVDAHLKSFDVSPDLSLQFKPGFSEMANTNGLSVVLNIGKTAKSERILPTFRD